MKIVGDIDFAPFGEKVDDGNADSVQSAGGLVRSFGKLSAEFQHGHDSFERGLFQVGMLINGNTASIVFDSNGAVVDLDGY